MKPTANDLNQGLDESVAFLQAWEDLRIEFREDTPRLERRRRVVRRKIIDETMRQIDMGFRSPDAITDAVCGSLVTMILVNVAVRLVVNLIVKIILKRLGHSVGET